MPKGERFYYRHRRKVIDGTRCDDQQGTDVCVDGKCLPVGCDMMLGSKAKEDACRVCGGDGSSCNSVQGVHDANNFQTGLNLNPFHPLFFSSINRNDFCCSFFKDTTTFFSSPWERLTSKYEKLKLPIIIWPFATRRDIII
jgi:hypothetical protein